MINIKQLQKDVEERQRKVIGNYDAILQQCYNKIMATNQKINDCYCFFSCPTFVFGVPLYNVNSCITYIMEKLILKGFEVKYTHPNFLYISWKNGLNPPVYSNADPNALNADSLQFASYQQPQPPSYPQQNMITYPSAPMQMQQYQPHPMQQQSYNTWETPVANPLYLINKNNASQQQSYRPVSDIYTDGSLFS
jgi:hypothetical protein